MAVSAFHLCHFHDLSLPPPLFLRQSRIWFLSNNKQKQRWTDIACCRLDPSLPHDYTTAAWHRWSVGQALASLPAGFQAQYRRSIAPRRGQFTKRIADLFFIPRRLAKPLANVLVPAFAKARVWSEVKCGGRGEFRGGKGPSAFMFLPMLPHAAWLSALVS